MSQPVLAGIRSFFHAPKTARGFDEKGDSVPYCVRNAILKLIKSPFYDSWTRASRRLLEYEAVAAKITACGICVLLLVLLLISLGLSQAYQPNQLTRFPYMQCPTISSVTIVWETGKPTRCSVEYGTTLSFGSMNRSLEERTRREVKLSGLKANTKYYYRIFGVDGPLTDILTFNTAKNDSHGDFSFVVFGDSGTGKDKQSEIARQIFRVKPDLGLITGDVVYREGALEDYTNKYFLPYRDIISSVCFFTAMGNHDYRTDEGKPYLDTFVLPANNHAQTEKYYSFDYGNAHFVCLDSNLEIGGREEEEQFEWVKEDLSSTEKLWKFVFLHHPPYSSSHHGSDVDIRTRYCPLFENYSVDMVFCGHDHNYERTVKINDFFPEKNGVTYIVTGGGGARLYKAGESEWTAFSEEIHHFVRVKISGETLLLTAIDHRGELFDRLILEKDLTCLR